MPHCDAQCSQPVLVIHDVGRCGYSACAERANLRPFCLGCGAAWMEAAA